MFKTSFDSWRDAWLLDIGATCCMTFLRDLFEDLNDNVHGAIYFVDRASLIALGIRTIKFKFPGFLAFLLDDVLYLPKLQRNLLSLVHIE